MSEPKFAEGQRVTVAGRLGTVRFCGGTKFAAGVWVGIELDDAVGKNSGTVQDVEYFRCPPEHGIFVRPPMVQVLDAATGDEAKPRASRASLAAGASPKRASGSEEPGDAVKAKEGKDAQEVAKEGEEAENKTEVETAPAGPSEGAEVADEGDTDNAAAKKAAAEKAAAEEAAEKAAAEKAAAEKAAADKAAAAEKAAAAKAAAEKAEADKAAAQKAAEEKAEADKAATQKAAEEKAEAERAAAAAAAEKVAAEKVAAAEQAKRAQEASAAQLAASKAQANAEAELRSARQEVTRLKNDIERAKSGNSTERERLTQLKWRREQALQQMEKLAQMDYGDVEHSEEVLHAQAEMKRAAEAAEKLRSELNQKKNNVSTMLMIRSKLKKKVENVQDQSQLQAVLQEKLDAAILGRLMAEERVEELKLELAEAELKREEEAEEKARLLVQMVNVPTPAKGEAAPSEDGAMAALMKLQNRKKPKEEAAAPEPAPAVEVEVPAKANITRSPSLDAYQEALRVLHQASQQEVEELQKQIAVLDQDSNKVPKLKNDQRALTNRQNLLQERMADLETEALELEQTAKAGDELLDLRDSLAQELRQEVEGREERVQQLEDLVLKLDKERRRLQEEADRDALDAKDLFEEVMKLTNGNVSQGNQETESTGEVHARLAVASVQLDLARLDLATGKAKAAAFADCVPRTWQEQGEAPSTASTSLALALAQGQAGKAAERVLFRLEGLGRRAAASSRSKMRMEMCEVACVAFRCAASVASSLDGGFLGENPSTEASKKAEAQFKRLEEKLKELMHKNWPLDSPSQALNCLQEIENVVNEVAKAEAPSTRGFRHQFQRFQVAFTYGVASHRAAEAAKAAKVAARAAPMEEVKQEKEEDGAMAALMRLQNRNKKPEDESNPPDPAPPTAEEVVAVAEVEAQEEQFQQELWPEIELRLQVAQQAGAPNAAESELQRLGKAIEVGLGKCSTGEEKEPSSFWRALKAASDFWQSILPPSETRMDLLRKNAEEALSQSSARLASEPPAWATSSLEVQSRIEEIDEKQREVREAQEQLKERKKQLTLAEEEMLKAEDRQKDLKAKLSAMIEASQASDALEAEEAKLRQEVAAKAHSQAQLLQQFEEAKAKRDKLEQLHKEEEKKRKKLEDSIEKMRHRPKQDEDGRATAPEFAALRLSQMKGARELYALQVSGMEALLPLPENQDVTTPAEECVQKYTTLRKSLLKHLSSTRVQRLGVRNVDEEVVAGRMQELHFQLSEARSSLTALRPSAPTEVKKSQVGGDTALKMALRLQPPRWAQMKIPRELHSSSWSDIREIHVAAA